jgi:hypothetical protein
MNTPRRSRSPAFHRVAYDIFGEPVIGHEAEIRIALACQ